MKTEDLKIKQIDDTHVSISAEVDCDYGLFEIILEKVKFSDIDITKNKVTLSGDIIEEDKNNEDKKTRKIIINTLD